ARLITAGDLRLLLRRNRRGSRRRRMPRHGRGGRAAGPTGRLLRRSAWSDHLRRGTRCGGVWRNSRGSHLPRGSLRPWLVHGRSARWGRCVRGRRCVRGGSCGGGTRGWRSSLLLLRLRGRGCRHRSRNDKNCRDACVPLGHDTTLLTSLSTGGQTGKADYVKALSRTPTVSFSQLFVDALKKINRVEQAKTILPVIDVEAEPILALPGLT